MLIDGGASSTYWTGTRLYEKSGNTAPVRKSSTELGLSATSESELNMGDKNTLSRFINHCKTNYEGNYALVLWNHGGGWREYTTTNEPISGTSIVLSGLPVIGDEVPMLEDHTTANRAVCWDESSSSDCLYMDEVQQAVTGKGLTVIGFDACLMGMIEVAYEIRNKASYMIASEQSEPGDGWDYTGFLNAFKASSNRSALDLCSAVVDTYGTFYGDTSETTLSAVDLSKIDGLFSALNTFAQSLYNSVDTDAERDAVNNTIINDVENYCSGAGSDFNIDLWHLADTIQNDYDHNDTDCANLKSAIENAVIENWNDPTNMPDSHGIAIHFAGTDSSGYLGTYSAYCNGYPDTYPVDFVQSSSNKWVAHYSGGVTGPGLLYRLLYETLP